MVTSRERIFSAFNFQSTDRVPKDLAGMGSTGISAFSYPKLVAALGLPPRLPRIHDTNQMLALPDLDVLDVLGCDVVTIQDGVLTNAFEQPEVWHEYDFNGRLPAKVRAPGLFKTLPDGSIIQPHNKSTMPPTSYVFDEAHGGQPVYLNEELPKDDLKELKKRLEQQTIQDEEIEKIAATCRQTRQASDRAIFFSHGCLNADISIHSHGGMAVFPILCITEPNYVADLHAMITEQTIKNIRLLLPEIKDNIDIIMMAADDWGTQQSTIASPKVFQKLFLPYRKEMNAEVHRIAPQAKCFLHSCGAIYNLLDYIVECGFDILNPVQWPAGGHSYMEWKDKARKRITLWGGGVNAQQTLPLGSLDEIRSEVAAVTAYLGQDGGFVFANIHNLLAEIPPEKIIAMFQTAGQVTFQKS